ncbi:MAG: recombination protein RecR [Coxiella sp. RIFCSPHIGHO2_12_FULL_42_15]|nr:MAG: recombination protein RecR [Coxiella sp. RIFCSPHIGHO2_12_FULL_42_15]
MFSPLTNQLIEALRGLPSVGPKSAQRMAFHILSQPGRLKGLSLSQALQLAIEKVGHCRLCRTFTEQSECHICRNIKRNRQQLCVVESPADIAAIEHTNSYSGHYFVLHGHLSPLDGIGPQEIGIPMLLQRISDDTILEELILATNPTIEGKATAHYIANHVNSTKIKCSRIAHGVPLGGELEYLDGGTLCHAFQARMPLEETH